MELQELGWSTTFHSATHQCETKHTSSGGGEDSHLNGCHPRVICSRFDFSRKLSDFEKPRCDHREDPEDE